MKREKRGGGSELDLPGTELQSHTFREVASVRDKGREDAINTTE